MKATQLCLTLCNPIDYTVHGILQARILEWVAFPFSRGFSRPRDQTQVSCIAGGFFTNWATGEALRCACTLQCGLQSARLLCPWDSPGKNTGVGLLCPPTEDLPNQGTEPASLMSPALVGGFFTTSATCEAQLRRYLPRNQVMPPAGATPGAGTVSSKAER